MDGKQKVIAMLKAEFARWDNLLGGLSGEQVEVVQPGSGLTIKDQVAHLYAWQQRTIARTEAAARDRAPVMPKWPEGIDIESPEGTDRVNAWIYETNRDRPWAQVYGDWRSQFQRIIALAEQVEGRDMVDPSRYAWLHGMTLAFILQASYEHHDEHYDPLATTIRQRL